MNIKGSYQQNQATPSSFNRTEFRLDINGLRAWAVSFVILYHFGVPGFGGGFVGVDVFFVISGFLMTGIITRGLERGNFSLGSFYFARATRIVPALIALCAFLLAAGWWFLPPPEYLMLGTHSAFTLAFLSNIKFWLEAGYFDAASHEKWLLHTWSLAVEWQFYLLLPLALMLAWKLRPRLSTLSAATLIGLLASLSLSIALTQSHPSAAFYLLPTRAWEMLSGGLMYFLSVRFSRGNPVLERTGLALIIASVLLFDSTTVWPGWQAMLPVAGTMLVLHARQPNSLWTGNRIAQWLGTCSYSLYLWHWPVVAGLSYFDLKQDRWALSAGLLLTLMLGQASFSAIELPARRYLSRLRFMIAVTNIAVVTLALGACSAGVRAKAGYPGRLPSSVEIAAREADNHNPRRDACHSMSGTESPSCVYGGKNVRAIVLGDSHANALISAIVDALPSPDLGVLNLSYSSCPTARGLQPSFNGPEKRCPEFNDWAWKKVQELPAEIPLIIINHTSLYLKDNPKKSETGSQAMKSKETAEKITGTACEYAKSRSVYMTRPIPTMEINVPKQFSHRLAIGIKDEISISQASYTKNNSTAWSAQDEASARCGVKILDTTRYLCNGSICMGSATGRPYYYDDNHLSEYGNKVLTPMFAEIFSPS